MISPWRSECPRESRDGTRRSRGWRSTALSLTGRLAICAPAIRETASAQSSSRRTAVASNLVDIHEIARGPWLSTTRPAHAGPSVADMTALDVTTPRQHVSERPRPILWLRVVAQRRRLDRMLAAGASPATDTRLAMRARQLVQPSACARLAAALHDAARSIDEPRRVRFQAPAVPVDAPSVRACADELRDLAHGLTGPHPRAGGVVLARDVLTDTTGPLYTSGTAGQLRSRLLTARAAL